MNKAINITEIDTEGRSRKDMGNLTELADSIKKVGLLHPPVVTKGKKLIAGYRRIEAAKLLGWAEIPVNVADNLDEATILLEAERDENTCRKEWSPEEMVHFGSRFEAEVQKAAKGRQAEQAKRNQPGAKPEGGNFPPLEKAKTRDVIGGIVGVSGKTYDKAKAVVESGDKKLITEMNASGVDGAHKKLMAHKYGNGKAKQKKRNLFKLAKKMVHAVSSVYLYQVRDEAERRFLEGQLFDISTRINKKLAELKQLVGGDGKS